MCFYCLSFRKYTFKDFVRICLNVSLLPVASIKYLLPRSSPSQVYGSDDEDDLNRKKRAIKKRVAEQKRDRLLQAIAFNKDSPVPGQGNTGPGQQVVHIGK